MSFPKTLFYTKDHEWTDANKGLCKIGVTSYAIEQLGDIVHVDLPKVGTTFVAGDSFGTIESTKTVSDLYMPLNGKVIETNKSVLGAPESLQTDPYNEGWLIKIEVQPTSDTKHLLDCAGYEKYLRDTAE